MFIISSTIVLTCACLTRFRFVSFAPYSELSISRHRFNLLLFLCVLCHCISCHRLRLCNRASTTLHIVLLLRVYHFTLSQSLSLHRNMRRRCYANVTIKRSLLWDDDDAVAMAICLLPPLSPFILFFSLSFLPFNSFKCTAYETFANHTNIRLIEYKLRVYWFQLRLHPFIIIVIIVTNGTHATLRRIKKNESVDCWSTSKTEMRTNERMCSVDATWRDWMR